MLTNTCNRCTLESQVELKKLVLSELKPLLNPTLVVDGAGLLKVTDLIQRVSVLGYDLETNLSNRFYNRQIRTAQIGDRHEQFVIDLLAFADGNSKLLVDSQRHYGKNLNPGLKLVADTLRPFLDSKTHVKVGMYLQFESEMSAWNLGLRMWNLYSIDLADKVLLAGELPFFMKGNFNMEGIVARRLKYQIDKTEQKGFDFETPLTQSQINYAALDVRLPLAVKNVQAPLITSANLWRAVQIENDVLPAFGDMHLNGVLINHDKWSGIVNKTLEQHKANIQSLDTFFEPVVGKKIVTPPAEVDALEELSIALREPQADEIAIREEIAAAKTNAEKKPLRDRRDAMAEARRELKNETVNKWRILRDKNKEAVMFDGEAAINYSSPDQLYDALTSGHFKGINKNTLQSTDDDDLKKLAAKHPVCAALQEARGTEKHLKSYGPGWILPQGEFGENEFKHPDFRKKIKHWEDPDTGHVHSACNQMGTDTGRPSSTKPNVYNIAHVVPISKEEQARLGYGVHECFEAPPGYTTITMDMSGAELRIIAEMSGARVWLDAFANKEDVHSLSTEILYPTEWLAEAEPGCLYYIVKTPELTADENLLGKVLSAMLITRDEWDKVPDGKQLRLKCKCSKHKPRRDNCKTCNFLIAYKGGPRSLAVKIGSTEEVARDLMGKHEARFGEIWGWLKKLGEKAKMSFEARTFSHRRRLFKRPTWDMAKAAFFKKYKREPVSREISKQLASMYASIDREGTNSPIQGGNADIAKTAMGAGFDKDGKPFMWHEFPKFGALLSNHVYDEFVVWCPDEQVPGCVAMMKDCVLRAGREFMCLVDMLTEQNTALYWKK